MISRSEKQFRFVYTTPTYWKEIESQFHLSRHWERWRTWNRARSKKMQIENNSNAWLVPNARFFQLKGSVTRNYELSSSEVYKLIPNQINMHCYSTWTIPLPSQVTFSILLLSLITKPKQHSLMGTHWSQVKRLCGWPVRILACLRIQ